MPKSVIDPRRYLLTSEDIRPIELIETVQEKINDNILINAADLLTKYMLDNNIDRDSDIGKIMRFAAYRFASEVYY